MGTKDVYEDPEIVDYYRTIQGLQASEESILAILRGDIGGFRMLDIGIGAGRTTEVFAPLVSKYVGVDYSSAMVDACRDRFRDSNETWSFQLADARSLVQFDDRSFDFVLFSFNGIDSIDHNDRMRALEEIKRVLTFGGVFVFSTHNLNSPYESRYSVRKATGPGSAARLLIQGLKLRILNPSPAVARQADYALLRDGTGSFRATNYWVKPESQRSQLHDTGFRNIRVFGHPDGQELSEASLAEAQDPWLYFLCARPHSEVEGAS